MTETVGPGASLSTPVTGDHLKNVLLDGICGDIRFALKHGRNRAALILIYAGIDAMASLERPDDSSIVREYFVKWVDTYMDFESGSVPAIDLYGARCGMVHTYGAISKLSKAGKARSIGYTVGGGPDVIDSPKVEGLILVSVEGLAFALFRGIARYLDVLIADNERRAVATTRLLQMFREVELNSNYVAPR